jgi:hypothetical protein
MEERCKRKGSLPSCLFVSFLHSFPSFPPLVCRNSRFWDDIYIRRHGLVAHVLLNQRAPRSYDVGYKEMIARRDNKGTGASSDGRSGVWGIARGGWESATSWWGRSGGGLRGPFLERDDPIPSAPQLVLKGGDLSFVDACEEGEGLLAIERG